MNQRNGAPARRGLACTALALLLIGPFDVYGNPASLRRVRSGSAEVSALLDGGYARSATFRALVDRLERSAVIVYVRFTRCPGRVPACLRYLGERAGQRYAQITIDRFAGPGDTLCRLLAHELQHAVELADAPWARTNRDVRGLLTRIGHRSARGFETDGAVAAARAVERELAVTRPGDGGPQP